MIVTITTEASSEIELAKQLKQITRAVITGHGVTELMDGSYQIGVSNVEIDHQESKNTPNKYQIIQVPYRNKVR
jgi:hypothetical protein